MPALTVVDRDDPYVRVKFDLAREMSIDLGFRHDGELRHIQHDGRIEVHPREADMPMAPRNGLPIPIVRTAAALNGLVAGLQTIGLGLPEQLTDHAPVNYTAHLEAAG